MRFNNIKEITQLFRERRESYSGQRESLSRYFCDKLSYYEGIQWGLGATSGASQIQRLRADLNPDSLTFRPTLNRVSRFTQQASVATAPVRIELDVFAADRDTSAEAAMRAQLLEDMAHLLVDRSGLLECWDDANFGRSLFGSYLVGLTLRPSGQGSMLDGGPDCLIKAFRDNPLKLTLDPYVTHRHLHDHEEVIYSDAWSYRKIMRMLGPLLKARKIEIREQELATLGSLCTFEMEVARYTNDTLYGQYRLNSETRGANVHEMYAKDDRGRFSHYSVMIELPKSSGASEDGVIVLNDQNMESPWGGCGLPWKLIHGYRRGDGVFGIGEVAMQKDDQDRLNRLNAWRERQEKHASKHIWIVDENSMGQDKDPAKIARRFTNAVAGIVTWNSGLKERPAQAPQVQSIPAPNGHFGVEIQESERSMREQVHRAAIHSGQTQTHTPLGAVEIARDEASQTLDKRVHEDRSAMAGLIEVGTATLVKLVRAGSPGTIKLLEQHGFEPTDLGTIAEIDPAYTHATFKVREGSIRMRSATARKADLDNAMQLPVPVISASEYRREMSDMDVSLTRDDRLYSSTFAKYAMDLLTGIMPMWEPVPLGSRAADLVEEFRKAMIDRRATPEAKQRLAQAIQQQMMFEASMTAMLAPQQPEGQGQAAQQPMPPAGTIDDLMAQLAPQVNKAA